MSPEQPGSSPALPDDARSPAARPSPCVLLGIDGRSGAGKTTLAAAVARQLRGRGHDVELFHLEDLYPGWDGLQRGIEAYVRDVLTPLRAGRTAHWYPWDWALDRPAESARRTRPAAVVLCEGVGAGAPPARPLLDGALTLTAPEAQRKHRALERDGETYRPFWDRWAAQEEAQPVAADRGQDLTLPADAPDLEARAVAWAVERIATAPRP